MNKELGKIAFNLCNVKYVDDKTMIISKDLSMYTVLIIKARHIVMYGPKKCHTKFTGSKVEDFTLENLPLHPDLFIIDERLEKNKPVDDLIKDFMSAISSLEDVNEEEYVYSPVYIKNDDDLILLTYKFYKEILV